MNRFESIKDLTIKEIAIKIIESNVTDKYCKGLLMPNDGRCYCYEVDEITCAIIWLLEVDHETI